MRKKKDIEKRKSISVSMSIIYSLTIDGGIVPDTNEFEILEKQIGLKPSEAWINFLVEESGLTKGEYLKKIRETSIKIANSSFTLEKANQGYRKYLANKIKEEHPNSQVKKRMSEYLENKEYL